MTLLGWPLLILFAGALIALVNIGLKLATIKSIGMTPLAI
jgi:hypothetical protein